MRRIGNIFDDVVSFENLLAAARLAMKGSGRTLYTCRFFYYLEPEVLNLQEELKKHSYLPGAYRYFTVYDPKQRVIAVAPFRGRVVHHAVVRVLEPIYERRFIYDSYATRRLKGTHAAIVHAQKFIRRRPWYLKADIEQYFPSIDHAVLMRILKRKIKDPHLLDLLERIVNNSSVPGKGLPIGNLTSQFLANVYLDSFDHWIKDHLGVKGYLRYMDDFILFGQTKNELKELKAATEEYLSKHLLLKLKSNATWLNRSSHGLSFLGMRIFPGTIRVKPENRRRSLRRLRSKVAQWQKGELGEEQVAQSVVSIMGHLRYFCPAINVLPEAGTL